LGIALLVRWRTDLAKAVFTPLLSRCSNAEPDFSYRWREQETPLRALLTQRIPATLPQAVPGGWDELLLSTLRASIANLKKEHNVERLQELPWRLANTIQIRHPFSKAEPLLAGILDMPAIPGACNSFCVKVLHGENGASERLVIAPNHPEDGILQMPGGQSGHPLSAHYRDQQGSWTAGAPSPFLPGRPEHQLKLLPGTASVNLLNLPHFTYRGTA